MNANNISKKNILSGLVMTALMLCMMTPAQAQKSKKQSNKGYDISIKIDGYKDSVLLLGNYYLGDSYAIDSSKMDKKGYFHFTNKDKLLMPGLYFFSSHKGNFVEFVIYNETMNKVVFHTKNDNWTNNMTVENSPQNSAFYEYHKATAKLFADGRQGSRSEVDSVKEAFIRRYPDNMLAIMMESTRPVSVPWVDEKGDSLTNQQRYHYFTQHYFDNMPIDQDFMTRTPKSILVNPTKEYMAKTLDGMMPEQIIPLLDSIVERARPSKEVFHYLVHTFTEYYLKSNVMVYDEIYVHMIKRYYETGEAFWASPSTIDKEVTRANKWEKILVGKTAPELILNDTLENPHSLHRMPNQLKLLVFWSPSCGHCKTTIPEINEKLKELRKDYDVAAFAIFTEPDDNTTPRWKQFIRDHDLNDGWIHLNGGVANVDWREVYDVTSTPRIFLLDHNNKIVAKNLNAEIFEMAVKANGKKKNN